MTTTSPLVVINIVGLTPDLLGPHTPNLNKLIQTGEMKPLTGVFPAVTTTAQATMLTGRPPKEHGVVGNGWYFKDRSEINFWLQPDQLMLGDKVWQVIRQFKPDFNCSKLFWWYNMYGDVNRSMTPRPHYPADGRKIPALYSHPSQLQAEMEDELGTFPFFNFWGPAAGIASSRWIVDCAIADLQRNSPDLQLVYLPHLDYNLQRLGPEHPDVVDDVHLIDQQAGRLIDMARKQGAEIIALSEYGINPVNQSVSINKILRQAGYLQVRQSPSGELLDAGASRAFAVTDHQIAHIYVRHSSDLAEVQQLLRQTPGIEQVLGSDEKRHCHLDHPRCGDLITVAESNCWFDYFYWLDDRKAPDFARTVDIHRKPGYDPLELFIDPQLRLPKLHIAKRLLQKKLGMRMLMDVIPLDTSLVKGSHGRLPDSPEQGPLIISSSKGKLPDSPAMEDVFHLIVGHFSEDNAGHKQHQCKQPASETS